MDHTTLKYSEGFVFTRIAKGDMYQNNSVRIDLSKFSLSSENRRILKKVDLNLVIKNLPLTDYDWKIGKMAKDFYEKRNATFSANKIKELLTTDHNFNTLLDYGIGYCICYMNEEILHYCYPFYASENKDTGMNMMLRAIMYAKEKRLKYVYLGSYNVYKMQFAGVEVFRDGTWSA
jgi:arginyl-tRNA--protein-N-Asp/Glu arginylyltransferase